MQCAPGSGSDPYLLDSRIITSGSKYINKI